MESYIYKTRNKELGYFQISNGKCFFYPINTEQSYVAIDKWDQRFHFEKITAKNPQTFRLNKTQIHEGMSYFLSKESENGRVEVIKTRKINDTGLYFPRINRGEPYLRDKQIGSPEMLDEIRAYENITHSLLDIFRFVEPEIKNLNAYGNKIRELLIVSCTEVEYLLKKILIANGINPKRSYYNTSDYIWALPVLKLNKYVIDAPLFPQLGLFSPFKKWNKSAATTTIFWYDHYNKVKHDRGNTKEKANLKSLINSITAIHILLEAQYGEVFFDLGFHYTFKPIFNTHISPIWGMDEICTPILEREGLKWISTKQHP